jgi:hypothetical protein
MLKMFGNNELEALRLGGRIHTSLSSLSVLLSCCTTGSVEVPFLWGMETLLGPNLHAFICVSW